MMPDSRYVDVPGARKAVLMPSVPNDKGEERNACPYNPHAPLSINARWWENTLS